MQGDEKGKIESERLREERNQGNDLDDDSTETESESDRGSNRINQIKKWSEVAILMERQRDLMREGEELEGIPSQIHLPCFPPAPLCCLMNG